MDRRVPNTGSDEIELYIRTYYSLLRSSDEVQIKTLTETHTALESSLHLAARGESVDVSALVYCSLRLPECIRQTRLVVLGQTVDVFARGGYAKIEDWQLVSARARRRRSYYDGDQTLGCYIASRSDIDDLIPILTAYQIEWEKIHRLLTNSAVGSLLADSDDSAVLEDAALTLIARTLSVPDEDVHYLRRVWGDEFVPLLKAMCAAPKRLAVKLLAGSLVDYRRATQSWWTHIAESCDVALDTRPVYFISSNTHSIVNMLSGFALRHEAELIDYIHRTEHGDLLAEWNDIEARHVPSSRENFLYYVMKKYAQMPEGAQAKARRAADEREAGILRIPSEHNFDVEAQVIVLSKLRPDWLDPRLNLPGIERLAHSRAVIVNIDYPLGFAAYQILSQIADSVGELLGVYVLGKAASLNGGIGDVIVPNVVHDEHSQNTFLFDNCLKAADVRGHLVYGTVLDNQKAVTVRGTFLQNHTYMDVFYREGYTDIEMEAGPYLSAIYEAYRPVRYPHNELVNLYSVPFDVGFLHYASDTPLSKGKNLGAGNLSYFGMDPTYATSAAILRRVFQKEIG